MGDITCKECGTEYDSDYSSCPNCGCNRGMDKPLKMLITAISVMLIIGAGAVFIIHSNHAKRVEMEVEILAMEQEAIEKKIASIRDSEERELQRIESDREERERRTAQEDAEKKRNADAEIARQYEEYQAEQQRMQQEAEMARARAAHASYENDMRIIDQIEDLTNSLERNDKVVTKAYNAYRSARAQYGYTIPLVRYKTDLLEALYHSRKICEDILRLAKNIDDKESRKTIQNRFGAKLKTAKNFQRIVNEDGMP